jgi:membrane fusion protein (multidrug efflux system)
VAVACALLVAGCSRGEDGEKGSVAPPAVVVGTVERQVFADIIEAVGTAFAREAVTLTSTVTERIDRLNFQDGSFVRKGQVIAELRRAEQMADLREVEARSQEARLQLDRLRELQERGFATNASVDQQQALADIARAQAQGAREQIRDRVIVAPFSGYISLRRISPGSVVSAGTEIARLSDLSTIKLDFTVPEVYLSSISRGQKVTGRSEAYPDRSFEGTVESIDPVVDPVTRSVLVRAVLPNPDLILKPGMLVTVDVATSEREVIAVPETSIIVRGNQSFVYRLLPDETVSRVPVELGMRKAGFVEVRRGLEVGQRIVTEGTVKLRDGIKVQPVVDRTMAVAPPEGSAPGVAAGGA